MPCFCQRVCQVKAELFPLQHTQPSVKSPHVTFNNSLACFKHLKYHFTEYETKWGSAGRWSLPCRRLGQPHQPPRMSCSSSHLFHFCSVLGEFFFPGQKSMKCSLHHGFPFQLFTFPSSCAVPLHSWITPVSSVLIFCLPHSCPLFPPQTPLAVRCCYCLLKILLLLPYALPLPQALLPCLLGQRGWWGGGRRTLPVKGCKERGRPPTMKITDSLSETKQCQYPSAANGFGKDPSRRPLDGKCVLCQHGTRHLRPTIHVSV